MNRDLQRSRQHLISAREEERRRIRADLHDDLAPTLAGLALGAVYASANEAIFSNAGAATWPP